MAIKRTAPQSIQVVQTSEQLSYRLTSQGKSIPLMSSSMDQSVLGIKAQWLYQDLMRTFLSSTVILAMLLLIKLSGLLS